jgi:hypothetical protein
MSMGSFAAAEHAELPVMCGDAALMGQDRLNNALDMTACGSRGSGQARYPLKPRAGMRLLDRGLTDSR